MRMLYRSMLQSIALSCAVFMPTPSPAMDLAPAVKAQLAANVKELDPIKVQWTQRLESKLPLEQLLTKIKDKNHALLLPTQETYALSGSRFYHHTAYKTDVEGKIRLQRSHSAFDGLKFRTGSDDSNRHNCFSIDTKDHLLSVTHPKMYMFYTEYFDAAGITIGVRAEDLFSPPKSQVLSLLDSGAELISAVDAKVDGHRCVALVIESPDLEHRYWLAQDLGYAVLRHQELNRSGQLLNVTDNSDFQNLPGSTLWLPQKSRVDYCTWHRIPEVIEETPFISLVIDVDRIGRADVTDALFVIDTTKGGSRIADSTIPGEKDENGYVQFNVPSSEKDLLGRVPATVARHSHRLLIFINLAIFAFCTVGFLYKRFRV